MERGECIAEVGKRVKSRPKPTDHWSSGRTVMAIEDGHRVWLDPAEPSNDSWNNPIECGEGAKVS